MSNISTIISAIKSQAATFLGSTYSELPYAYNIAQNSKAVAKKGYTVRPLATSEYEYTNRTVSFDQNFEFILNDIYLPSTSNDSAKRSAIIALYDKALSLYALMVSTRLGSNLVILVNNMSISEPEVLEESDYVTIRMVFSVKHKYNF
jgi:hypothetical protein